MYTTMVVRMSLALVDQTAESSPDMQRLLLISVRGLGLQMLNTGSIHNLRSWTSPRSNSGNTVAIAQRTPL
jgi:hypothetical protein